VEGYVTVPTLQATITGVLSGAVGACVAILAKSPQPWIVGLAVGSASWALSWLFLLREHRELLWDVERIIGADLDGDQSIGEPEQEQTPPIEIRPVTRVEWVERPTPTATSLKNLEIPIEPNKVSTLAHGMVNGRPFSEAEWAGKGRLLSGPKFRELQDWLLSHGYVSWRNDENHRLGVELSGRGRRLFEHLANDSTPLPQGEEG
jgi:hypothetical protein